MRSCFGLLAGEAEPVDQRVHQDQGQDGGDQADQRGDQDVRRSADEVNLNVGGLPLAGWWVSRPW